MLFDDPDDSEETQRWKNLALYKVPWTNAERDEAMPFVMVVVVLILLGFGLYALISH